MEGRNELAVIPVEWTEEVLPAAFNQAIPQLYRQNGMNCYLPRQPRTLLA